MSKLKLFLIKTVNLFTLIIFICFWGMMTVIFAVNYIEKNYVYPLKHKQIVFECADYYGLDRALVFAVIKTESSFDGKAESRAGAIGLMQITDKTGEYIAQLLKVEDYDLKDNYTNVWFGCFYLKYLLNKFPDRKTALCAYNAGEGNVALWLKNIEYSQDGNTISTIPFKETEDYVKKILKSYKKYKKIYANILDKRKNFE